MTFYSFKGGVGRSMALINTAAILAGRGFRVLVIDLDLEAPGLSYLDPDAPDVGSSALASSGRAQPGFVDLLSDAKERGAEADLFTQSPAELAQRYTRSFRLPEGLGEFTDGALSIMPAGRFDGGYASRLDGLNLPQLYQDGLGEPLIRAFKQKLTEGAIYDYVLVDSRTGFSDEAGICTRDLADQLMIVSGLNRQNIEGTAGFLKTLRASTNGDKRIQIILSPVPNGEDALLERREAAALAAFREAWGDAIDLSLRIPYHPQLALTEEPHIFRRRRGYLFDAYRAIEEKLLALLGHEAWTLRYRINEQLLKGEYTEARLELDRLVRFENGRQALTFLARELGRAHDRAHSITTPRRDPDDAILKRLLASVEGRAAIEFVVENIIASPGWDVSAFAEALSDEDLDLAFRVHERCLQQEPSGYSMVPSLLRFLDDKVEEADRAERYLCRALMLLPTHSELLAGYARFLETRRRDFDGAEQQYRSALELAPQDPWLLWRFATFLETSRGDLDVAESQYKAALEATPKHVDLLQAYARFLERRRGDLENAERFHRAALEAEPDNEFASARYAGFLAWTKGDLDRAEQLYTRAIQARPNAVPLLGSYATFLWLKRHDAKAAEIHFQRALQAAPSNTSIESNFGQMLVSMGRIPEGVALLHSAYEHKIRDRESDGDLAEVCFGLWLASLMSGQDATPWERRFKFLIERDFDRHRWSLDEMLEQARESLSAADLGYAHALADAFLDASKVAMLDRDERWRAVIPLEPN